MESEHRGAAVQTDKDKCVEEDWVGAVGNNCVYESIAQEHLTAQTPPPKKKPETVIF